VVLHHSYVQGVTGRETGAGEHEILGEENIGLVHRKHSIDRCRQDVKGWLDPLAEIGRAVAVKDLVKDLGARRQSAPLDKHSFDCALGVDLMWMLAADEIHRNVRVEEDQSRKS
jgi:hypothetical protein